MYVCFVVFFFRGVELSPRPLAYQSFQSFLVFVVNFTNLQANVPNVESSPCSGCLLSTAAEAENRSGGAIGRVSDLRFGLQNYII